MHHMGNRLKKVIAASTFLFVSVAEIGSAMPVVNDDVQMRSQVLASVSTSTVSRTPAQQDNHVKYGLTEQAVNLINEERSKAGVKKALVHNKPLERKAMSRVIEYSDGYYNNHHQSTFRVNGKRIKAEGCSVEGVSTLEEFIAALKNKDAFRNMILDPDFERCGVSRRGTRWVIELRGEILSSENKLFVPLDDDAHSDLTTQAINLINEERSRRGIDPLRFDEKLENRALFKVMEICSLYYDYHHGSKSQTKKIRIEREGGSVEGVSTLEEFITTLKSSDVFRNMILNSRFQTCGVSRRGTTWVIELRGYQKI